MSETSSDKNTEQRTTSAQSGLKKGVIRLSIPDMRTLYELYMPFVDGCGVFVPTDQSYTLGQDIFLFLTLPENIGKFAVSGRVVWINPKNRIGKRQLGIGVQIRGRETEKIRKTIDDALGKALNSGLPTATM